MGERTTAAFVASSVNNGLEAVHFTWAGTFVLEAAVFLYPNLNFILADADCVPLALFEVGELETTGYPFDAGDTEAFTIGCRPSGIRTSC